MHNPNKKGIEQLFHKIVFRKKKNIRQLYEKMHSLAQFVNGILDASLPAPGTRLSTLVSSVAGGKTEASPWG